MCIGVVLAPSVDRPAVYGLGEVDGGSKAFLDFTDCDRNQIKGGMPIQMSFRRRMKDQTRGFTGYFWKAVPKVQG